MEDGRCDGEGWLAGIIRQEVNNVCVTGIGCWMVGVVEFDAACCLSVSDVQHCLYY